jgi:hypothetical protein
MPACIPFGRSVSEGEMCRRPSEHQQAKRIRCVICSAAQIKLIISPQ